MTSYVDTIQEWAFIDRETLQNIERLADAAHVPGMHDERVECIVYNAFNGMGDTAGSDDYGHSVAWIDVQDHIDYTGNDVPEGVTYENVGAYLATWRDMAGCRYALAYIDANGCRSAIGYETRADMMHAYRAIESDYLAWEESADIDA